MMYVTYLLEWSLWDSATVYGLAKMKSITMTSCMYFNRKMLQILIDILKLKVEAHTYAMNKPPVSPCLTQLSASALALHQRNFTLERPLKLFLSLSTPLQCPLFHPLCCKTLGYSLILILNSRKLLIWFKQSGKEGREVLIGSVAESKNDKA